MPRRLPKNVVIETSRHGKRIYYFRSMHGARIRLPSPDGADFAAAVAMARQSEIAAPRATPPRPSFQRTQRQRVGKAMIAAVRGALKRAANKGVAFDLTVEWAIERIEAQDFKCPLTGIPFYMDCTAQTKVHPFMPSLDRIIPGKGYVADNVRIVVYAVNIMLMDWGTEVFERVANGYRYTKGTKARTLFPHRRNKVRTAEEIAQ